MIFLSKTAVLIWKQKRNTHRKITWILSKQTDKLALSVLFLSCWQILMWNEHSEKQAASEGLFRVNILRFLCNHLAS